MKKAVKFITTRLFFLINILLILGSIYLVILQLRGEVQVNPEFDVWMFQIKIYGIVVTIAITVFLLVLGRIIPKELESVNLLEALIWVIIPTIIMARAWHVVTDFNLYENNLIEILKINQGGTSLWGALVGALIGISIYTLMHGFEFKLSLNYAVATLPLAQAIGRFANFFKQELFGPPTDFAWGMYVRPENRPEEYLGRQYFHPTPIYEAIGCFILFLVLVLILMWLYKKKKKLLEDTFIIVSIWSIGYGIIRFFVEFYRLEDEVVWFLTLNQVIVLCLIFLGTFSTLRILYTNFYKKG